MDSRDARWEKLSQYQEKRGWQAERPAGEGGGGRRPPERGPGSEGNPPRPTRRLPNGYLEGGYFDENGNLRPELLLQQAREVAEAIGDRKSIAYSQLRRFYEHVRAAENRMN